VPALVTTRRLLALGALLTIGFAIYGSLVPLHARHITLDEAVLEFRALRYVPFVLASKTDFLSNFVLFLPIGFLLTGAIAAGRPMAARLLAVVLVSTLSAALSLSIEFAQIFIPGRTASLNDIANETMGAIAGALAWLAAGPPVARWMSEFVPEQSTSTELARRLLTAYAAVWLVLGLLPFDVTLRPAELAEKLRAGRVQLLPFHSAATPNILVSTALLTMPIGALAALGWPRARRHIAVAEGTLAAAGVIATMEVCQLFVFSRTASADDVVGGIIGAAIGANLARRLGAAAGKETPRSGVRLWPLAVLAAWLTIVLARNWSPFDFVFTGDMLRQRSVGLFQVPFKNYYWANPFDALGEAITKVLLGLPVGALLTLTVAPARRRSLSLVQLTAIAAVAFAIFSGVELGQVFLPSRYPDGTDVLLGTVGACLGSWGTRVVQLAHRPGGESRST